MPKQRTFIEQKKLKNDLYMYTMLINDAENIMKF